MATTTPGANAEKLTLQWAPNPLDPRQGAAARSPVGPTLILGGPGTGKSHTLVARAAALIAAGADNRGIVAFATTSRKAEHFAVTLSDVPEVGDLAREVQIQTFHSYVSRFTRLVGAQMLGISPDYSLWDRQKSLQVLKGLADAGHVVGGRRLNPKETARLFDWHCLNRARGDQPDIPAEDGLWHQRIKEYTAEKRRQNALDFHDLTDVTRNTLQNHPDLLKGLRQTLAQHLLIDDFQDATPAQYAVFRLLAGTQGSITVASDPNSSFRSRHGSDRSLAQLFVMDHHGVVHHSLPINHRAQEHVAHLGTALLDSDEMSGLRPYRQGPIRPPGELPRLIVHHGPVVRLDGFVLDEVERLFDAGQYQWNDIAFLYADAKVGNRIATSMSARRIPHFEPGRALPETAPDRAIVENLLALIVNPRDMMALQNAVKAGLSNNQQEKAATRLDTVLEISRLHGIDLLDAAHRVALGTGVNSVFAKRLLSVADTGRVLKAELANCPADTGNIISLAYRQFRDCGTSERMPRPSSDLQRLFAIAAHLAQPDDPLKTQIITLLDQLATADDPLLRSTLLRDPNQVEEGITLTTFAQSQGHEWPVVVLLDCVDDVMPGRSADGDKELLQEAQRLFYSAVTRAKDRIYVTCPVYDASLQGPKHPSRFFAPLEPFLYRQNP